jgi:hypothetical protein
MVIGYGNQWKRKKIDDIQGVELTSDTFLTQNLNQ